MCRELGLFRALTTPENTCTWPSLGSLDPGPQSPHPAQKSAVTEWLPSLEQKGELSGFRVLRCRGSGTGALHGNLCKVARAWDAFQYLSPVQLLWGAEPCVVGRVSAAAAGGSGLVVVDLGDWVIAANSFVVLHTEYTGQLGDGIGLYRSDVYRVGVHQRVLIVTQLEVRGAGWGGIRVG